MTSLAPEQMGFADEVGHAEQPGSVECLGMTFSSDDARRAYFLELLGERLADPAFRAIEGFPIGSDEDILRISDPPYYTACPNPFLDAFVRCYGRPYDPEEPYSREPFAVDVSEGKTDPIYTAHSYHTKVPHKAIMPAILHYTEPGDLVLDGFAGSGMTGVAAQMCGSPDREFKESLEREWRSAGASPPRWGARRVVLNDLSPAATFIEANYNIPFDVRAFEQAAKRILSELEHELGWMYETLHTDGKTEGRINYTVWSEVFSCPNCSTEITFLKEALDMESKRVRDEFPCPSCATLLNKDSLQRLFDTQTDPADGSVWKRVRLDPVIINYTVGGTRYEKAPDAGDLELLERIAALPAARVPANPFPIEQMYHGSRLKPKGFTHVHHFFLPRAAQSLAALWEAGDAAQDTRLHNAVLFFVEQAIWGMSVLARYAPTHFSQVNQYLSGVYYVGSQHAECSPWYILNGKLQRLGKAFRHDYTQTGFSSVTTGTATQLALPANSVDYIFTDPPFGENIYYADLNFLVESWHRLWTNTRTEAIVDHAKHKGLPEYQQLMQRCFEEYARVLKPGRWMTVVFHNSKNAVWNAIQEAIWAAGFVVADVRTLDKQQGSYRQVTSSAVKQDLVISTYKPSKSLEEVFRRDGGTEAGAWEIIQNHLRQLPAFVGKDGRCEVVTARLPHLLFDTMVAFHVQRGYPVPLSVGEFNRGLDKRFAKRDEMYFLAEQTPEYDKKRVGAREIAQLQFLVVDEESAILWTRQQLLKEPQTFQDLQPQFMRELAGWQKYERRLELLDLLEQNFLEYDGKSEVPGQIHAYLSSRFDDIRTLSKDDVRLRARSKNRWYVPDPNQIADLEKLREKSLLNEFDLYRAVESRRLKVFRLEALRTGFKRAWQERDYNTIVRIADKIPSDVLQEDQKLLMWFDQALARTETVQ